jgi:hypothetical protein
MALKRLVNNALSRAARVETSRSIHCITLENHTPKEPQSYQILILNQRGKQRPQVGGAELDVSFFAAIESSTLCMSADFSRRVRGYMAFAFFQNKEYIGYIFATH